MQNPADILVTTPAEMRVKGVHIISHCDVKTQRARTMEKFLNSFSASRRNILRDTEKFAALASLEDASFEEIKAIRKEGERLLSNDWAKYREALDQFLRLFLVRQRCVENITCTSGRSVLMQRLSGTTTFTGIVNYGTLGSSNTAPSVGQTTLGTEVYRKALSSGTYASNVAYLENFYTSTEVSGTFEEYGFVIDGSGSADTGEQFNRFTTTTVKSLTESMNVQSTITCNDA